ncbi:hypothetical protein A3842_10990 [Paenibacillus sp. P3E]|uniref:hypothetical protein n=1 Tax=Paenibacillus sp. P3E TaxID=1349435 RepID=UPI00093D4732|nr:hypothetical protein [Paenibacillus sp. P3E]OKP81599.1 hypothetical protein A3842_10990 [Paenibacillus sp. P3E]
MQAKQMFGVFIKDDDELFVMNVDEVFHYLSAKSALFLNYGVHTNGENVSVWEVSAGANGKLAEVYINEFFEGFEDEGIFIRKVSEWRDGRE